jgi:LDH2 family malate/lactate/ureidoglycolate dehydrogenase
MTQHSTPEHQETADADLVVIHHEEAEKFAREVLVAHDVPAADADIVATCLVRADLRGVETHGLVRLTGYLARIRSGLLNPAPTLSPQRVTSVTASLDGQDGFGFVVASRAMAEAVAMANESGVGVVSARRSTHFGMAANYVLQAVDAGMLSLVFTNASRAMPPWGGREALLGTSPLAAGAPGGSGLPYVLDMSPAVAARGKIRAAERRGESIPEGYALDASGRPTTDPSAAMQGVVLPVGGPKGSGLAMLMDIFGGVISGAAFAGDVGDQYKDFDRPQNVGHFFLAMRPDLFVSAEEYATRMGTLVGRVHDGPRADGVGEILMPGEREAKIEEVRRMRGIPYDSRELAGLLAEADQVGISPPSARQPGSD